MPHRQGAQERDGGGTDASATAGTAACTSGSAGCGGSRSAAAGRAVGSAPATAIAAPCCLAGKLLMDAVAAVCITEPAAVRAELAAAAMTPAGEREDGSMALVRGLVYEVRHLLDRGPRCLLPRLGRDGRTASYDPNGMAAADPCPPIAIPRTDSRSGPSATTSGGIGATGTAGEQAPLQSLRVEGVPLVAVALRTLAAVCGCSRRAARLAYTAGALDVVEAAGKRLTRGSVLEGEVERLYVALAARCQAATEDICTGSDVRGLIALMVATLNATHCRPGDSEAPPNSSSRVAMAGTPAAAQPTAAVISLQPAVRVLQEAVEADEPLVPVESMDEGGRLLLEEMLERQAMIADGSFDLERSFDDFRLVVGDSTL
ncbi:hypothetical protein GPECTOR_6g852 [Gonium pectorale]|uniref:Uncharacterized protein n=1 Tax=Gonium pectorale TaxID=33097 RepID=A0A150GVV8_GONPE|nr:hypothetical protein GPECTOR_6g852 [Gonium pectorale]|eukprot:KXZ53934.1 hypothetical protein GPECTOR_6g852 [Gonium pectorale]